jgi:hypothetical protein
MAQAGLRDGRAFARVARGYAMNAPVINGPTNRKKFSVNGHHRCKRWTK